MSLAPGSHMHPRLDTHTQTQTNTHIYIYKETLPPKPNYYTYAYMYLHFKKKNMTIFAKFMANALKSVPFTSCEWHRKLARDQ